MALELKVKISSQEVIMDDQSYSYWLRTEQRRYSVPVAIFTEVITYSRTFFVPTQGANYCSDIIYSNTELRNYDFL